MRVGSLVICKKADWSRPLWDKTTPLTNPLIGQDYVVRDLQIDKYSDSGRLFINLEEFEPDRYFVSTNFRELQPPMNISELIEKLQTEPACTS